jgi:RES domain-containing protein
VTELRGRASRQRSRIEALPRITVRGSWYRITKAGRGPFELSPEPADGRWQRGSIVTALYLADSAETTWAEWMRATAELGVPPDRRLPRAVWHLRVDVPRVVDLTDPELLRALGISSLRPTRRDWSRMQPVGESLWLAGARGLIAPSAAHRGHRVLVLFGPEIPPPGVSIDGRPEVFDRLPVIPTGVRT